MKLKFEDWLGIMMVIAVLLGLIGAIGEAAYDYEDTLQRIRPGQKESKP